MPTIKLKFKDKVLKEYQVDVGQTLTIGRNDSNDIIIDSLTVSGAHARIDSVSATFILTDLESTNGTFVNDTLISSHGLRNNDVIAIGKHKLLFDRSDIEQRPGQTADENDKTRYLDTNEYRDLISKTTGKGPPQQATKKTAGNEKKDSLLQIIKNFFS
jgi:pSer/pThr/pTyr-binding forkhead associated (FHA) protein